MSKTLTLIKWSTQCSG